MADLDTCFFCARTGEVTLDEYDVVPEVVDPTAAQQRTIMLCGTCSSKLDLVLETVLGAVDGVATSSASAAAASAGFDTGAGAADGSGLSSGSGEAETAGTDGRAGRGGSSVDVPTDGTDESRSGPDAAETEPEPIFGEGAGGSATSDGGTSAGTRSPQEPEDDGTFEAEEPVTGSGEDAGGERTTESGLPVEEAEPGRATQDDELESDGSRSSESGTAGEDETTEVADRSTASGTAGADTADEGLDGIKFDEQPDRTGPSETTNEIELESGRTTDEDTGETMDASTEASTTAEEDPSPDESEPAEGTSEANEPADAAEEDSEVDIDVKTYKRVVRLLRNRELPIDRGEFESLASSAYDIDQVECAAALDAAIERDLLVESGGQLDRA